MKRQDLIKHQQQTTQELDKIILEIEKQVVEARMKIKTGQETDLKAVKNLRRDLAQLKTIKHEKELAQKEAVSKE